MNSYQIYTAALTICGIAFLADTFWVARLNTEQLAKWESLPRNKNIGVVLTFLCLLWCVPHAKPIVWDWLLPWLYPLVVTFTFLSYFFLDYLFARATGAFFILLTYYFVHEGFTFHTPLLPLFAILCWIMGITGLFFSGKPHLMRDFIRKISKSSRIRYLVCAYSIVFGLFCLTLGIIQFFRR